jgi:hypothetical protein
VRVDRAIRSNRQRVFAGARFVVEVDDYDTLTATECTREYLPVQDVLFCWHGTPLLDYLYKYPGAAVLPPYTWLWLGSPPSRTLATAQGGWTFGITTAPVTIASRAVPLASIYAGYRWPNLTQVGECVLHSHAHTRTHHELSIVMHPSPDTGLHRMVFVSQFINKERFLWEIHADGTLEWHSESIGADYMLPLFDQAVRRAAPCVRYTTYDQASGQTVVHCRGGAQFVAVQGHLFRPVGEAVPPAVKPAPTRRLLLSDG